MTMIADDEFQRILARANDPLRRTYMAGMQANAQPLDFEQLKDDLRQHGAPGAQGLLNLADMLGPMLGKMAGGALAMGQGGPIRMVGDAPAGALAPPPSAAMLEAVEEQVAQPLPAELRQLYAIADGGFGPGAGLFALPELGRRYFEMVAMGGPQGQSWPKALLPIFDEDPVLICIDAASGAIIAWDPEEIEDMDDPAQWEASFKTEFASLADCMAAWVESPTFEEHMPTTSRA